MHTPQPQRLDLTRPRPGQRIHRSLTLTPAADGGARLAVLVGRSEIAADLSSADVQQLVGMLTLVQLMHGQAGVPA